MVLTDVQDEVGEAIAEDIRNAGQSAVYIHHDVTNEAAWEALIAAVEKRFGPLDILVNNAGVGGGGLLIEEMGLEDWRRCLSVNLDGAFLGVKHGILAMKQAGGSIINTSSILGMVSVPRTANYSASKGGMRMLTKAAALECAMRGLNIRVNAVHPGFIDTPLVRDAVRARGQAMRRLIKSIQPTGQMGKPEDVAGGILYLASDASKFVTGTELPIDGGIIARSVAGEPIVGFDAGFDKMD